MLLKHKVNYYFPSLMKSTDWVVFLFDYLEKLDKLILNNFENNRFIDMCSGSRAQIIFNYKMFFDSFCSS